MSRIGLLSPETAGGDATAILKEIEAAFGMVPNLFKAYAHHPPLLEANWHKVKAVLMQGSLSRKLKETIAVVVSRDNSCSYCVSAHTAALKSIGVDDRELKAIEEDMDKTEFSVKEKAILGFVRKANKEPLKITDAEFGTLQASGATKAEIVEALGVMEVFTSFNRLLKKSICVVVIVARHCGVCKNTPHSSLLDASHLELFEQSEQNLSFSANC